MSPDLFWIPGPWRGRLAIAARPRGSDWLDDEVSGWRSAGLDVVVSLLEKDEAADLELVRERETAEAKGLRFLDFPIPDRGVPASSSMAVSFVKTLVQALEKGDNVAVHCRQGIGRSGLIAAAILVASGIGVDAALGIVSAARRTAIPETSTQLQWIRRFPLLLPVVAS